MNWADFKRRVEAAGVTDGHLIEIRGRTRMRPGQEDTRCYLDGDELVVSSIKESDIAVDVRGETRDNGPFLMRIEAKEV